MIKPKKPASICRVMDGLFDKGLHEGTDESESLKTEYWSLSEQLYKTMRGDEPILLGGDEASRYVLASRYRSGSPRDLWCVGFFAGHLGEGEGKRAFVVDGDGVPFSAYGFDAALPISKAVGQWILDNKADIQLSGKSLWYFAACVVEG